MSVDVARPRAPRGRHLEDRTAARARVVDRVEQVRSSRRRAGRRGQLVLGGLLAAWLLAMVVRTLLGDFTITVPDFWRIVLGTGEVPGGAEFILLDSKLPRAVVGTACPRRGQRADRV